MMRGLGVDERKCCVTEGEFVREEELGYVRECDRKSETNRESESRAKPRECQCGQKGAVLSLTFPLPGGPYRSKCGNRPVDTAFCKVPTTSFW